MMQQGRLGERVGACYAVVLDQNHWFRFQWLLAKPPLSLTLSP